ncbi:MAG: chemotaxis protein CheW [Gammaproteobacteria bacterium]|nr:chemotaxis protein CheW [Gammaproteobacteria bacterium]MBU2676322.1 chemotaxis protein CheW [Gammaproteobacteria bacterium]NNC57821.1 purine-binding chemotaxis protein CheW [Woeseiaceae bacterium]NNL50056.1 purine-binding chemotaxis protein CheW [Woeseiaceae bacterium]
MSNSADLAALVEQPFALLQAMEQLSRAAHAGHGTGAVPSEWVGVGFRIGEEQFVASREQVREVLMLPDAITRVPGAKRWLLGIANLRGHLLPLIDVKLLLGSGRTTLRRSTRVISVNHREVPAGLVVDEVHGFRRFMDHEFSQEPAKTIVRCDGFLDGVYQRGDESWPHFNLFELVESKMFLQAAAE